VPVSQETLDQIALTRAEYDMIVEKLEREPNTVELGLFGALWSEHCGYKHSRPLLRSFPTTGASVQVAAGQENAGVVDIGDGLSVVFKIESHNHPSAVEPYQGAATGVGGIIRDILAMGARPIALLNSLRFGPLSEPRNKFLFQGVVSGISGYGNCVGIPDVGGEIQFAPAYSGNPLVNAMCVGLLPQGALVRSRASTPGNTLMLVGSGTGRDGIHGASGLASRSFEEEREMRPTVQVGDPFLEKVLIEACLEAARSGHLEGMQDLGAAGLTSAAMESAQRSGSGVRIDVSRVPRREPGMSPYEVMLSESQERMLLIVKQGHEEEIRELFEKWDLRAVAIGTVTGDGVGRILDGDEPVAEVRIDTLVEAPTYRPPAQRPSYLARLHAAVPPTPPPDRIGGSLLKRLLASPNIASKRMVYRQYDHEVQTNTVVKPGQGDAAVLRLRGTKKGLAVAVDGNGRHVHLEPYAGGAMAVAEACRNVVCAGATPVAVTDCLNFGNPRKPEVYYQLQQAIEGMAAMCRALGIPVVSGNVSLYNESQGKAIYPTPIVGAVGVLQQAEQRLTAGFAAEGDVVLLLGAAALRGEDADLSGSEFLAHLHNQVIGRPSIDMEAEARLQRLVTGLAQDGLLRSAHDCSDGGLAVAIVECSMLGNVGFTAEASLSGRWDAALFGERPSRVVVSASPERAAEVLRRAHDAGVPALRLGVTGGANVRFPGLIDEPIASLVDAYDNGLERALNA